MNDSIYYKATDEDGNTVLKHSWKNHKYLYIKNGKYVYPEDVKAGKEALERQKALALIKQHKQLAAKDSRVKSGGSPVNIAAIRKAKAQRIESYKRAQKAQHEKDLQKRVRAINAHTVAQREKDLQKRVRAINAHTVAKKNADTVRKKQEQITANVKKQNAHSTKVKKAANFVKKAATRDAAFKMAATKYLVDKAVNSPTANAAKSKARSVVSKAEYKIERAGQKLSDDANNAYKSAKKKAKTTANAAKSKARSVVSKADYKLTRAGEKLTNDVKSSGAYKSAKKGINSISKNANKAYKSAKKGINSISKNANKAYKSAKKGINSISRDANKAYKSAKKKVKKVNRTFNKVKRVGKAYLDYLTK